ncbi:heavy-metal-associated domain-containing protein [Ectothiorhodospiraceae bacterium 2226]|nr:heavy-metal-associated domain-containing protein [Ectothiorhodospiraceae bacterium 2226]
MQTEEFSVQNIKCGGCVATVTEGLREVPGVQEVKATVEGAVRVQGEQLDRAALAARLRELGYPER